VAWKLQFSKKAEKDAHLIQRAKLSKQAKRILEILEQNPFQIPPPFEKLAGELRGYYSRRINVQHRIIYEAIVETQIVLILRMWSHYE
jgi:Txe/YoeB family toxin of toxin-antitoxin system